MRKVKREERERVEALRAEQQANEVPVHQMPASDSEDEKRLAGGVSELPGDSVYGVRGQGGNHVPEIHELA